jgi:oligosaccharide repeat unit polymerase
MQIDTKIDMKHGKWVKKILLILVQLTLSGALLFSYFTGSQYDKEVFLLGNWGMISILMTIWVLFSWIMMTTKIMSHYFVFFLIAILFHFGQSWIELLSPDSQSYVSLTEFYSLKKINVGYFYSACCLMIIHLAVLIASFIYIYSTKSKDKKKTDKKPIDIGILSSFGLLLFIFSFLPKIIIDIRLFGYVSQGGYLSIYSNPPTGTILLMLYSMAGFFYPSVYVLLYCVRYKKLQWNILFYGVICYSLAYGFLIGNRGIMFMFIVSLILFRHFIYKKFTKRETLILGFFALFVLMLSSTIALTRNLAKNNITSGSIVKNIEGYNLVYSSISEFGGTAMSLLVGMRVVPNILPFGKGISYLASSALIIPDPLGLLTRLYPYASFSGVLNDYHEGLGGSFIAEAYYNFGDYGFIFMGILGIILGIYLVKMDLGKYFKENSTSIIWVSLMYLALLMYVRDQFNSITSGLLQYTIYPWLLYLLFKQILTMKVNKKAAGK